jgi:16S rRNA (guanine966-N2)-methyltransferase
MLRLGFGKYKGRALEVPRGLSVRPATAMVREYLVSVLGDHWRGARVLDLFSGSGALGLQALSLGAKSVEFVEMGRAALPCLLRNIEMLGVSDQVWVRRRDVLRYLHRQPADPYDLILIDPPYKMLNFQPLLDDIEKYDWLAPGGMLFIEHPKRMEIRVDKLRLYREKLFGNTIVKLYERNTTSN